MFAIQPEHLERLCPALKTLLDAELAAGNKIVGTAAGWPKDKSISVALAKPFLTSPNLPDGVVYRDINDPHWWKTEYYHEPSGHLLICLFP